MPSPITKPKPQPSQILSLPNDVLVHILQKALETSAARVQGKELHGITTQSILTEVGPSFKSVIQQNNLVLKNGVQVFNFSYPFTFSEAIVKRVSSPSYVNTFIWKQQHQFIGNTLTEFILHPNMCRTLQNHLLAQIPQTGFSVSKPAFTDGYTRERENDKYTGLTPLSLTITHLAELPKLENIEVNMPSSQLLKALKNEFRTISKISLYRTSPSTLMEVLHLVRFRHSRRQTENSSAERSPTSCCQLTELHLSVELPRLRYSSERSIEVEKIRDFVKIISNDLACFSTLKKISFRSDCAPEVIDELTRKMRRSRSSGIVPVHSDINLFANDDGKYINFGRKIVPETAHTWFLDKKTNIYFLCVEAKKGKSVGAIERHICKSEIMACGSTEILKRYAGLEEDERQWIKNVCKEYGNSVRILRASELHRKTILGLQFEQIRTFLLDMTTSLSNIRGISLHWFIFDHLRDYLFEGPDVLEKQHTLDLINTFHRIEWLEILINDSHTQCSEWEQQFVDKLVSNLPQILKLLVRHCHDLKSIVVSQQGKAHLPISDRSSVQEAISALDDIEMNHPVLDTSSLRRYLQGLELLYLN